MTIADVHATDPINSEYTLCGQAFDAADGDDPDDDSVARPIFGATGEIVTCDWCRRTIKEMKKYKRYRIPEYEGHTHG